MVYFFTNRKSIKIGYTGTTIKKRLAQLNTGSDIKLFCLGYITGNKTEEHSLHKKFAHARLNGEWFSPTQDLIDYINCHNEKPHTYIEYDKELDEIQSYLKISCNS